MTRPLIAIIGNTHCIENDYELHATGRINVEAVAGVCDAVPVVLPADPAFASVAEVMAHFDGVLFTGGRPNVHPEEYGEAETEAHGAFDRARDRLTLPLIRAMVERGQPVLAICRGFQEMNVAMGGTLYPEIRDLPGRMNHRMPPDGSMAEKFAPRHVVRLTPGGVFSRLLEANEVTTNTLHGQGIKRTGPRVWIEGTAEDGTPEAIRIDAAPGYALGVQWHPEWNAAADPVSRALFESFGQAARHWAERRGHRT